MIDFEKLYFVPEVATPNIAARRIAFLLGMAMARVRKQYRRTKARMSWTEAQAIDETERKKEIKREKKRKEQGWEDIVRLRASGLRSPSR